MALPPQPLGLSQRFSRHVVPDHRCRVLLSPGRWNLEEVLARASHFWTLVEATAHHIRNVVTAFTASASRSPQTGFGNTGARGTTSWIRVSVSRSVHPVTKTIGASHIS